LQSDFDDIRFSLLLIKNLHRAVDTLSYKTVSINKETANKEWIIIDANGQILGRLASRVAKILRGKHKATFTPHTDCGDNVIIVNAEKVRLTGKKWSDREHLRHTGYPGGQRVATPAEILVKKPTKLIEQSVKGMLPKNRLGRALMSNLKVFAGTEHPHEAQQPKVVEINKIK